jgi:hypothetical protein
MYLTTPSIFDFKMIKTRESPLTVNDAGKLKFGAEKKGKKEKKAFLNNWSPWNWLLMDLENIDKCFKT